MNQTRNERKQAQRRPAADRSRHKSPERIFSHLMFEMNCYYFHRFSWEKYTKMIGHMLWLYQ